MKWMKASQHGTVTAGTCPAVFSCIGALVADFYLLFLPGPMVNPGSGINGVSWVGKQQTVASKAKVMTKIRKTKRASKDMLSLLFHCMHWIITRLEHSQHARDRVKTWRIGARLCLLLGVINGDQWSFLHWKTVDSSRPSDKGGGGSSRSWDRGGGPRASVWSKNKEGTGAPGPLPWIRHWWIRECFLHCFFNLYSPIVSVHCVGVASDRVKRSDVVCVKTRTKWDRLKRS